MDLWDIKLVTLLVAPAKPNTPGSSTTDASASSTGGGALTPSSVAAVPALSVENAASPTSVVDMASTSSRNRSESTASSIDPIQEVFEKIVSEINLIISDCENLLQSVTLSQTELNFLKQVKTLLGNFLSFVYPKYYRDEKSSDSESKDDKSSDSESKDEEPSAKKKEH